MSKGLGNLREIPLGYRMTNQRRLILDYLRGVKTHPTAKMIYREMKKKLPQLSFGTVYRNLNFLVDQGYILALRSVNDYVHYDGNPSQHPHLICEKCGKIFDLEDHYYKNIFKTGKKTKHGKIKYYRLNFYGLCNKCREGKTLKITD